VEHLLAPREAAGALPELMARVLDSAGAGSAGVLVVRRGNNPAPLFMQPEGARAIGLGLFARFDRERRADADSLMGEYAANISAACSGKRYLSGFFSELGPAQWAAHYGQNWAEFQRAKSHFDRAGLLHADFIHF
jgi:hypothetical protein